MTTAQINEWLRVAALTAIVTVMWLLVAMLVWMAWSLISPTWRRPAKGERRPIDAR